MYLLMIKVKESFSTVIKIAELFGLYLYNIDQFCD